MNVVFFDIDGTLWDWQQQIPPSTIEAVRALRANGHKAIICSGRSKANIRDRRLLDIGFDGIVAACGTYVEIGGKVIFNKLVEPELVKLTVDTIIDCKMPSVLEGHARHWISDWGFEGDDFVTHLFETLGEDARLLTGYSDEIEMNKFSADVLKMTEYDKLKETLMPYYDFVEHGMTPDLQLIEAGPMTITAVVEAVPKGYSKANGVSRVCEFFGVDPKDAFAFGDSANDIEMFDAVGHPVAMGNAKDAAKERAEWITTDLYEDGIYNGLKHYGLI